MAAARRVFGVGHSLGASCLLLAAMQRPAAFAGLVLFEPIARALELPSHPLVDGALRRVRCFASKAEALRKLERALHSWDERALAGYVERGFRARADGAEGVELCCEPQVVAT